MFFDWQRGLEAEDGKGKERGKGLRRRNRVCNEVVGCELLRKVVNVKVVERYIGLRGLRQ